MGGIMTLSDAFCRVNRARSELLSPEDFHQVCREMNDSDNSPVKMRTFDSGVLVLQIQSQTNKQVDLETEQLVSPLHLDSCIKTKITSEALLNNRYKFHGNE